MWTDSGGFVHTASGRVGLHRPVGSARLRLVPTQKITGPDDTDMTGFVVVDLEGAPHADGVVRCAKKILMDGARTMARSRTYGWALLERQVAGASAAINVVGAQRDAGVKAFVEAVQPRVASGELSLDPGKGVSTEDLAPLASVDGRSELRLADGVGGTLARELTARSVLVAAATALDGLDGRSIAMEGAGELGPALVALGAQMGARVVAVGTTTGSVADPAGLDAAALGEAWRDHGEGLPAALGSELDTQHVLGVEADVLMCGSKLGVVDHGVAAGLSCKVLAPVGVAPVTAKGLAVASRRGVTVLADFLTLSGALHSFRPEAGTAAEDLAERVQARTTELTAHTLSHAEGPYLGACERAETFLLTWQDELPFGRPLA